ncbi:MAG: lipoate--protein ligase family protein [Candidatus Thorarchaeota archaeon]|nr:lipoate--protein ligase family protein [Candidatus Thorarchaeota archaeon]
MPWRLLDDLTSDIYRNLAFDEALAKTDLGEGNTLNTVRFWRSNPAVVIGRFQCVHKEVNLRYCEKNGISIARRFTGGGAVYHDKGNLNFTLRLHQSHEYVPRGLKELYETFIGVIVKALVSIKIPARFDPVGSCIRIGEKKISGTAGWIKQGVSFIHGTLLFNADLEKLVDSLIPPPRQPTYLRDKTRIRCMDSKRDTVTNINDEVQNAPAMENIKLAILQHLKGLTGEAIQKGALTVNEKNTAQALYYSQYQDPSWNLGTLARFTS